MIGSYIFRNDLPCTEDTLRDAVLVISAISHPPSPAPHTYPGTVPGAEVHHFINACSVAVNLVDVPSKMSVYTTDHRDYGTVERIVNAGDSAINIGISSGGWVFRMKTAFEMAKKMDNGCVIAIDAPRQHELQEAVEYAEAHAAEMQEALSQSHSFVMMALNEQGYVATREQAAHGGIPVFGYGGHDNGYHTLCTAFQWCKWHVPACRTEAFSHYFGTTIVPKIPDTTRVMIPIPNGSVVPNFPITHNEYVVTGSTEYSATAGGIMFDTRPGEWSIAVRISVPCSAEGVPSVSGVRWVCDRFTSDTDRMQLKVMRQAIFSRTRHEKACAFVDAIHLGLAEYSTTSNVQGMLKKMAVSYLREFGDKYGIRSEPVNAPMFRPELMRHSSIGPETTWRSLGH